MVRCREGLRYCHAHHTSAVDATLAIIVMMTTAKWLSSAHTCIGLPGAGQLIFVASYYDYVRLRNFLKEQGVEVAALSEYAPPKEAARARSLFMDGRLSVALLTERSHFYNRARVRGVKVIVL